MRDETASLLTGVNVSANTKSSKKRSFVFYLLTISGALFGVILISLLLKHYVFPTNNNNNHSIPVVNKDVESKAEPLAGPSPSVLENDNDDTRTMHGIRRPSSQNIAMVNNNNINNNNNNNRQRYRYGAQGIKEEYPPPNSAQTISEDYPPPNSNSAQKIHEEYPPPNAPQRVGASRSIAGGNAGTDVSGIHEDYPPPPGAPQKLVLSRDEAKAANGLSDHDIHEEYPPPNAPRAEAEAQAGSGAGAGAGSAIHEEYPPPNTPQLKLIDGNAPPATPADHDADGLMARLARVERDGDGPRAGARVRVAAELESESELSEVQEEGPPAIPADPVSV